MNNVLTTGATEYNRTNYDRSSTTRARSFNAVRAATATRPTSSTTPTPGRGGRRRRRAAGRWGGARPHAGPGVGHHVRLQPEPAARRELGFTHQVLGAEAPISSENIGSDADKMNIPGTNGPDRLQGGLPSSRSTNLVEPRQRRHGQPVPVPRQDVHRAVNLQKVMRRPRLPRRRRIPGSADQPLPAPGRRVPDRARNVPVRRPVDHAAECGGTVGHPVQFLGGLPARAAVRRRQGRAARQPELDLHEDLLGVPAGHVASVAEPDAGPRAPLGTAGLADAPGRQGRSTASTRQTGSSTSADTAACRRTPAQRRSGLFLPRAGMTYRLGEKTVFRARLLTLGRSDQLHPVPRLVPERLHLGHAAGPVQRRRELLHPGHHTPAGLIAPGCAPGPQLGNTAAAAPGRARPPIPRISSAGSIHSWNITVERELTPWLTAQAAYVGTRAIGQMSFVNINAGAPGTGNAGRPLFLAGPDQRDRQTSTCTPHMAIPSTTVSRRN